MTCNIEDAHRDDTHLPHSTDALRAYTRELLSPSPFPCLAIELDGTVFAAGAACDGFFLREGRSMEGRSLQEWMTPESAGALDRIGELAPRSRVTLPIAWIAGQTAADRRPASVSWLPRLNDHALLLVTLDDGLRQSEGAPLNIAEEMKRVQAREHLIATHLQEALKPPIPRTVPGLRLRDFYRAGLSEASVGGDFVDVYTLGESLVALVIGDVAGKGLAAASQVAALRNMLRYALFRARTLQGAIVQLNVMLTSQGLLPDFACVFVALFDSAAKTLTYVSCGHEPVLLRRASDGSILELASCGPPLGIVEEAAYRESTETLSSGDCLLLYTDGLSECGVDRKGLFGVGRISAVLKAVPTDSDVDTVVEHIVKHAEAHAHQGFGDDVCLLAGIVA